VNDRVLVLELEAESLFENPAVLAAQRGLAKNRRDLFQPHTGHGALARLVEVVGDVGPALPFHHAFPGL
jgi:hypothetical protein